MTTAQEIIAGSQTALAKLLTQIEDRDPDGLDTLEELLPHSGKAHLIGVTGPSGAGKSTLVNKLALSLLESGAEKIGILAVDPSSPFSGGAILGDRVRMRAIANSPGIFIRSMASRGAPGGLADAAFDAALALDAAGYDPVIIETVGAGQSEVAIASLALTTIVVEAPGLGDDIQAAKAGLLEIADILVVNKSDKPESASTVNTLRAMLEIARQNTGESRNWEPAVLPVSALEGDGIEELLNRINAHASYIKESGAWQAKESARHLDRLVQAIRERLYEDWQAQVDPAQYEMIRNQVAGGKISPRKALRKLFK